MWCDWRGCCFDSIHTNQRLLIQIQTFVNKQDSKSLRRPRSFVPPSVCNLVTEVQGKVRPRRSHKGPEGKLRYSSTLSLTLTLEGGGWLTPRPGRFTLGKEIRYPLYRSLGGPRGRSGQVRKISPSPAFDPRTVQPVARRCTNYATPAHLVTQTKPVVGFSLHSVYHF